MGPTVWCTGTAGLGGDILIMQGDGRLVMYFNDNYNMIWQSSSYTYPYNNPYLFMRDDGNLVIYDDYYGTLWSSGTQQRNFFFNFFFLN